MFINLNVQGKTDKKLNHQKILLSMISYNVSTIQNTLGETSGHKFEWLSPFKLFLLFWSKLDQIYTNCSRYLVENEARLFFHTLEETTLAILSRSKSRRSASENARASVMRARACVTQACKFFRKNKKTVQILKTKKKHCK